MKRFFLLISLIFCFCSVRADHQIIVCENSEETVSWAHELLETAEQSIEFSPCFFGGELLHEMLGTIERKMKAHRKLRVNMIMSTIFLEPSDKTLLARLEREFPHQFHVSYTSCVISLTSDLVAIDNHVKMLVIDETYFIMGGTNYDYAVCAEGTTTPSKRIKDCAVGAKLPSGARDQDIVGKGSLARQLREDFFKLSALWDDFNKTKRLRNNGDPEAYQPDSRFFEIESSRSPFCLRFEAADNLTMVPESGMWTILGAPNQRPNKITNEYCRLIDQAKDEIWIGNLHYSPVDPIADAMMRAIRRGVKVYLITNGIHKNSPEATNYISIPNRLYYCPAFYGKKYKLFEKQKCSQDHIYPTEIYEYDVNDILYHKKVMVIDKKIFVLGSYNLSVRSDNSDHELIMVIDSEEVAKQAIAILRRDTQFCRPVSPKQAREWYFDLSLVYRAEVARKFNSFF